MKFRAVLLPMLALVVTPRISHALDLDDFSSSQGSLLTFVRAVAGANVADLREADAALNAAIVEAKNSQSENRKTIQSQEAIVRELNRQVSALRSARSHLSVNGLKAGQFTLGASGYVLEVSEKQVLQGPPNPQSDQPPKTFHEIKIVAKKPTQAPPEWLGQINERLKSLTEKPEGEVSSEILKSFVADELKVTIEARTAKTDDLSVAKLYADSDDSAKFYTAALAALRGLRQQIQAGKLPKSEDNCDLLVAALGGFSKLLPADQDSCSHLNPALLAKKAEEEATEAQASALEVKAAEEAKAQAALDEQRSLQNSQQSYMGAMAACLQFNLSALQPMNPAAANVQNLNALVNGLSSCNSTMFLRLNSVLISQQSYQQQLSQMPQIGADGNPVVDPSTGQPVMMANSQMPVDVSLEAADMVNGISWTDEGLRELEEERRALKLCLAQTSRVISQVTATAAVNNSPEAQQALFQATQTASVMEYLMRSIESRRAQVEQHLDPAKGTGGQVFRNTLKVPTRLVGRGGDAVRARPVEGQDRSRTRRPAVNSPNFGGN